ncbi:MAG TPA: DNA alkylation repair protein [Clostridiales bacterium UBA8960]|nr:DNA alkylation repair protein [Clostridiales bacterium UBA8960]
MFLDEIMHELAQMGTERTKKYYVSQGAVEPVFGVATGAMKPLFKMLKNNQEMAEALYATGNYDAMYLAGMIADVRAMKPDDYFRWMETAYFPMISNFVVAVTLAESEFAQEVADQFIQHEKELYRAAGWSCYEWLLGSQKDEAFDQKKIEGMLNTVLLIYETETPIVKKAMAGFVVAVGISFKPQSQLAQNVAEKIDTKTFDSLNKELSKGRLGFKRKHVRC